MDVIPVCNFLKQLHFISEQPNLPTAVAGFKGKDRAALKNHRQVLHSCSYVFQALFWPSNMKHCTVLLTNCNSWPAWPVVTANENFSSAIAGIMQIFYLCFITAIPKPAPSSFLEKYGSAVHVERASPMRTLLNKMLPDVFVKIHQRQASKGRNSGK